MLNEIILERIESRLKALGIAASKASELSGLSKDAIRNLQRSVRNHTGTGITVKTLEALAPILDTTVTNLLTGEDSLQYIPVLSEISAGVLEKMNTAPFDGETISIEGLPHNNHFALKVSGRSMDKIAVDGAVIIVDQKSTTLLNGHFYIFENQGEGTFKRYNAEYHALEAYSWSGEYSPIKLSADAQPLGEVKRVVTFL